LLNFHSGGYLAMLNLRNRSLCLFALCGGGLLHAQQGGDSATLAGKVFDQVGKPIQSATVIVKSDAGAAAHTVTTDSDGRFSATGLPVGAYTIEATALGFAKNTRAGIQLSAGKAEDLSITLTIESLSQSVIVSETVSVAVQEAPSGNTLDATSAKTEISGAFIKNFMAPTSDFAEVVNLAPGTFSLNPNGIGLGQGKTYFRGFQDGEYTMTFDGIPFEPVFVATGPSNTKGI
jgi:iron complex outermembrane receptor protein